MSKLISANKLLELYKNGYFPMANQKSGEEIKLYRPLFRFIIPIVNFHTPKRLLSYFKKSNYEFKINTNFNKIIKLCQNIKRKDNESWINDTIINSYINLNKLGFCHSVECFDDKKLVGGLYGVHIGSCFFGESMFSLKPNSSKFCLLYLLAILKKKNFLLLDSQFYNPHLEQFNAYEIKDTDYMFKLNEALKKESKFEKMNNNQEVVNYIQSYNHKS